MSEKSRLFHIHVDAHLPLSDALTRAIEEGFGVKKNNFVGHPEGYLHFEPVEHFTLKIEGFARFKNTWNSLVTTVQSYPEFTGYLEAESISWDRTLESRAFDPTVPCRFRITRRRIDPSRGERFREAELHLVMDKDASDPRLIKTLCDAGLFGAYIPKQDHVAVVLTAQGDHERIVNLAQAVEEYVQLAGGACTCTLKSEVAVGYWLQNIDARALPEVVDQIEWK